MVEMNFVIDNETWDRAAIPARFREDVLSLLVDPEPPTTSGVSLNGIEDEDSFLAGGARGGFLPMGGSQYALVTAGFIILKCMSEYSQFSRCLPLVGIDVFQRMAHLIRHFAKEAMRLIVGGEAVHKPHIKRISALHLVLCAQLMEMLARMLPKFENFIARHYTEGHSVAEKLAAPPEATPLTQALRKEGMPLPSSEEGGEEMDLSTQEAPRLSLSRYPFLDMDVFTTPVAPLMVCLIPSSLYSASCELRQVGEEMLEHRNKVYRKLQEIFLERLEVHTFKWLSVSHPVDRTSDQRQDSADSTLEINTGAVPPHDVLKQLVKEIQTLHKVLLRYCHPTDVEKIFAGSFFVFGNRFNSLIVECFNASLKIETDASLLPQNHAFPAPFEGVSNKSDSASPYDDFSKQFSLNAPQMTKIDRYLKSSSDLGNRLCIDLLFLFNSFNSLSAIQSPLHTFILDLLEVCCQAWNVDPRLVSTVKKILSSNA
ncbi:Vps54 family protein [Cardiosporidium cionae]|uniref:Vps54 family protein n=1 Tax=Cardiosporidium cionae TaxID=476202 RepID=A0ABQ7J5M3_9APIC|nr:Vps54 family protein [Cardiosporidium cionae]|eukprot:KAF8819304.1 Vps54 family protein [Cardiosporidium cionae]